MRLDEQHAGGPDWTVAVALEATLPLHPRLSHRLQVRAGAEGAVRSGEDGDVQRLVGLEAAERIGKRRGRRAIDCVGDIGAVDRDDCDGTLAAKFDAHDRHSYPIRTPAKDRALPRAWRSSCRCSVKPAV